MWFAWFAAIAVCTGACGVFATAVAYKVKCEVDSVREGRSSTMSSMHTEPPKQLEVRVTYCARIELDDPGQEITRLFYDWTMMKMEREEYTELRGGSSGLGRMRIWVPAQYVDDVIEFFEQHNVPVVRS